MALSYTLKVVSTIPLRNDIEVIKHTLFNFQEYLKRHPSQYYKEIKDIRMPEKGQGVLRFTVVYNDGLPVAESEVIVIHNICEIEKCCEKIMGTELCVRVKKSKCDENFGPWMHIKAVASGGPGTVIQLTYEFKAKKGEPIEPCFLQFDLRTILSWDDFSIYTKEKCPPGCDCDCDPPKTKPGWVDYSISSKLIGSTTGAAGGDAPPTNPAATGAAGGNAPPTNPHATGAVGGDAPATNPPATGAAGGDAPATNPPATGAAGGDAPPINPAATKDAPPTNPPATALA